MNPKNKIRVSRQQLIDAIQAKYDAEKAAYDIDVAVYPAKVRDYNKVAIKVARAWLAEQQSSDKLFDWPGRRFFSETTPLDKLDAPSKPTAPRDVSKVIQQLNMSPDETILLSVEDFNRYL